MFCSHVNRARGHIVGNLVSTGVPVQGDRASGIPTFCWLFLIQLGSRSATKAAHRATEHLTHVSTKDSPEGALSLCTRSLFYKDHL